MKYIDKLIKNNTIIILSCIITVLLGFYNIGTKSLSLDEGASYFITNDFNSMITKLWNYEGNMWFYYGILHLWKYLGNSELILRSLSVLFGTATIITTYFLAKKLFNNKVASVAVVLLPFHIIFIRNIQFIRGYTLLLFLTSLSTYIFLYLTEKKSYKYFAFYTIFTTLAIYTHLFSILLVFSHFIYVLITKNKEIIFRYLITLFVILLMCLPLLLSPSINGGQIINWIQRPDIVSLVKTFIYFSFDSIYIATIISCVLLYNLFILKNSKDKKYNKSIIFLSILFVIPLILVFILSYIYKPYYHIRYFTFLLTPFIILLSYIIIRAAKIWKYILVCIIIFAGIRLYAWYNEINLPYTTIPNKNAAWKEVVNDLKYYVHDTDKIILSPSYTRLVFDYYNKEKKYHLVDLQPVNLITGYNSAYDITLLYDSLNSTSRIVYIRQIDLAEDITKTTLIKKVLQKKHKLTKIKYYPNITIEIYENTVR